MDRIDKLIQDNEYITCINKLVEAESDRKYCRHGLEHSMDVARIGYIINMEERLGYDRSVIYAMALLHDLGRCEEYEKNVSHHAAGAVIARGILERCGYSGPDTDSICEAIAQHRNAGEADERSLGRLLYRADKLSRNCFACSVYDECYWPKEIKNRGIRI